MIRVLLSGIYIFVPDFLETAKYTDKNYNKPEGELYWKDQMPKDEVLANTEIPGTATAACNS